MKSILPIQPGERTSTTPMKLRLTRTHPRPRDCTHSQTHRPRKIPLKQPGFERYLKHWQPSRKFASTESRRSMKTTIHSGSLADQDGSFCRRTTSHPETYTIRGSFSGIPLRSFRASDARTVNTRSFAMAWSRTHGGALDSTRSST